MPNIEDHLRKAMAEGKFDDLPGKGKPIHLDEINPHAGPGWELAYKMLKDAGYTLPWIETRQEIEMELAAARSALRQAWEVNNPGYAQENPDSRTSAEWVRAQQTFRVRLEEINQRIRSYNLQVPTVRFQRSVLNFKDELHKVTSA